MQILRPFHGLLPMQAGEAAPPASPVTIAWCWVIEELAGCKEFDTSILAALLRCDPRIIADHVYGRRAGARLTLRYLDELVDSAQVLPSSPPLESAIGTPVPESDVLACGINVGPSSESTLWHTLQKVGGLNITGNCIDEPCRSVLRQFILQKRDASPKTSLELLKELILEDCRQGASTSSKYSCLVKGDKLNSLHTHNADDAEIASKKRKLSNSHVQQVKLLSAISSKIKQRLLLEEDASKHVSEQNLQIGADDNNTCSTKQTFASEFQVEKNEKPQCSSQMKTGDDIQFPDVSEQNVQIGADDNNICSTKQTFASEFQVEKNKKLQCSSQTKNGDEIQIPDVPSDTRQRVLSESSSDGEGYYDAAPDFHPNDEILAAETLKLLKSQNKVNSQLGDWTQQRSCIKCDEGGQVLICTGSGCPIAVHESCLGSSADVENPEHFKCPFCSYLLAASAYYEARKRVSIARKTLSSFMGWERVGIKRVESRHARKLSNRNHPDTVCANHRREIIKESERQNQKKVTVGGDDDNLCAGEEHLPMNRNDDASPPSGETETVSKCHVLSKSQYQDQAVVANECHVISKSQHQEHAVAATVFDGHAHHGAPPHKDKILADGYCKSAGMATCYLPAGHNSAVANSKPRHANAVTSQIVETNEGSSSPGTGDSEPSDRPSSHQHAQGLKHQHQASTNPDTTSLPCQGITTYEIHNEHEKVIEQDPAIVHDVDRQKPAKICSGEHSSSSKDSKRQISARRSRRYTNPMFPYGRRNRLPWTCEEEAILKEAMQKFYQSGEKGISWVKIWEFGRHIFHRTRQPADLKDKWRNIRMREG